MSGSGANRAAGQPAQAGRIFEPGGFIVAITAPSGAGKTTVINRLLRRSPRYRYSVSATTRPRRNGERDGRDYYFLSRGEFDSRLDAGEFAEWAEVHGNLYGTLRSEVDRILAEDCFVLMDVDIQGAESLRGVYPDGAYVFLIPPSMAVLRERLSARGTEDEPTLRRRLETAKKEIRELGDFDYLVVNDELEATCDAVEDIIRAETRRLSRLGDPAELAEKFIADDRS